MWNRGWQKSGISAHCVDYVHIHLRFEHLFSLSSKWRWAQTSPQRNTIRLWMGLFIPSECVCVCVCVCVFLCACAIAHTHACIYSLLSRPRCLVFYRDHRPFTATSFTVTVQVWLITARMKRDSSQTSAAVSSRPGKHPQNITTLQSFVVSQSKWVPFKYLEVCWHLIMCY